MLRPSFIAAAVVLCTLRPGCADTIQLKDKAAVTGQILAEKRDSVVVDVGYTAQPDRED
jgi:hypothetical protein